MDIEPITNLIKALKASLGYATKPFVPDTYTSIFVALQPSRSDTQKIIKAYNLHPSWADELHVTMVYTTTDNNPDADTVHDVFANLAKRLPTKITARLNGVIRFNGEEKDAVVLNVDGTKIEEARGILTSDDRIKMDGDAHGFTPHMTIDYIGHNDALPFDRLPETLTVEFNLLQVSYAGDKRTYHLSDSGVKQLSFEDAIDSTGDTIDDETGETAPLNTKRRRSYNMDHVKEG